MNDLAKENNFAATLITEKKYSKANTVLRLALKKYPQSPELLINMGSLYQLTSKPKKAIDYFQKCLRLTQKYPQVYSKLLHQKMQICDWENIEKLTKLANKFSSHESPFTNILRVDNPRINQITAKNAKISTRLQ